MIQKYDLQGFLRKRALTIVIDLSIFYIFLAVFSDVNLLVQYFHKVNINFLFLILLSFTASIFFRSLRQGRNSKKPTHRSKLQRQFCIVSFGAFNEYHSIECWTND